MEQNCSILVWDQDDPSTLKNVIEAIQEFRSVCNPLFLRKSSSLYNPTQDR